VNYNLWFFESLLHQSGTVNLIVNRLGERRLTYNKDGALWYKATEFGGEKDEVLIRGGGTATYFAVDIAYHYNKFFVRGFDTVINIWGADHHGHVARLKGAMDAIGLNGDALEIVLMQFVRLVKDGEPYRMSKRTGRSVTLADVVEEVPVDCARFFFLMREPGSTIDFDLDLALEQSAKNPVYYVQYAHARICSIIRKLAEEGVTPRDCGLDELSLLSQPEEVELIRCLARCPGEIIAAAERRDPAGLPRYLTELAALFHKFYTAHKVRVEDEQLMQARLSLCAAVKTTLNNILTLLKISAPESM
jgi:arginyl-tRNA synthetase